MTGRAEIYKVVPWVILEMQGAGWAPHPLALEFGVVCVGVPSVCRCACVHGWAGQQRLGGKAQQAPWAGVFGAPFRARVLWGLDREGGRGRGFQGTWRGSPRSAPRAPSECVSFWKRRAPGRGWDARTGPGAGVLRAFRGFQPALRIVALASCSSRTAPGGEVEPGSSFSCWATLMCLLWAT